MAAFTVGYLVGSLATRSINRRLAKALVKTIEYRAATPSKLEETLFYDHPAVGSRVRMAMDWKAEQLAKGQRSAP